MFNMTKSLWATISFVYYGLHSDIYYNFKVDMSGLALNLTIADFVMKIQSVKKAFSKFYFQVG